MERRQEHTTKRHVEHTDYKDSPSERAAWWKDVTKQRTWTDRDP